MRLLSYIKGLQSFLRDCIPWLAPLLQTHARAQLAVLLRSAVLPMAQGTLLGHLMTPQASYDAGLPSDRGKSKKASLADSLPWCTLRAEGTEVTVPRTQI